MTIRGVSDKKGGVAGRVRFSVWLLSLGAATGWLTGCGGGQASEPVTLVSITVTPANASLQAPASQQFTATGAFSDASTKDITNSVSWTSSDTSKATIQNSGLATVVAAVHTLAAVHVRNSRIGVAPFRLTSQRNELAPL